MATNSSTHVDIAGDDNDVPVAVNAKESVAPKRRQRRFSGVCNNCGKKGHKKRNCKLRKQENKDRARARDLGINLNVNLAPQAPAPQVVDPPVGEGPAEEPGRDDEPEQELASKEASNLEVGNIPVGRFQLGAFLRLLIIYTALFWLVYGLIEMTGVMIELSTTVYGSEFCEVYAYGLSVDWDTYSWTYRTPTWNKWVWFKKNVVSFEIPNLSLGWFVDQSALELCKRRIVYSRGYFIMIAVICMIVWYRLHRYLTDLMIYSEYFSIGTEELQPSATDDRAQCNRWAKIKFQNPSYRKIYRVKEWRLGSILLSKSVVELCWNVDRNGELVPAVVSLEALSQVLGSPRVQVASKDALRPRIDDYVANTSYVNADRFRDMHDMSWTFLRDIALEAARFRARFSPE